ncbi:hypothetical protein ACQKL0_17010 [Peribacillus sp. NPDC097264]|uniref:hypothetical protein n=1 Tax=unclassified Peribacillus TaxID=2675266 RepID=UPI003820CD0F
MKKPVKLIIALSLIIIVILMFFVSKVVFNSDNNSEEAADTTVISKDSSYLKDTEKVYIVQEYNAKKKKDIKFELSFIGTSKGYDTWYGADTYLEKENKYGLFYGDDKLLAYPVEVGKKWDVKPFTFNIESVDETVTTPAGTFNNVVKVRTTENGSDEYNLTYYAKGVGQILKESVDSSNKKTIRFELQEIKEK